MKKILWLTKRKEKGTGIVILLLCLCVLLSACYSQVKAIHSIASEYLSDLEVSGCSISACDFSATLKIQPQIQPVELSNIISFIIDDFFSLYYHLEEKLAIDPITENDLVQITILIKNQEETLYQNDNFFICAAESGGILPEMQQELIGQSAGESGICIIPETEEWLPTGYAGKQVSYIIRKALVCTVRSEIYTLSLNSQGISSPSELYAHLFRQHMEDLSQEKRFQAREAFISAALENCRFEYNSEEVEGYAEKLIQAYDEEAEQMGMTLSEYWEFVREYSPLPDIKEDPFLNAIAEAKREIGTILWVGAMASYLHLDLTEDELLAVSTDAEYSQEQQSLLRYQFLEDKVIGYINPGLYNSLLTSWSFPEKESETRQIPIQTRRERSDVLKDIEILQEYLQDHPRGLLAQAFCGTYTDAVRRLVVLLTDPEDSALVNELEGIGLQSDYQIKEGVYPYERMIALWEKIQQDLDALKVVCQKGLGDEKAELLFRYNPILMNYSPEIGKIQISFFPRAIPKDQQDDVIALFEEVIGTYEEVMYIFGV